LISFRDKLQEWIARCALDRYRILTEYPEALKSVNNDFYLSVWSLLA